MVTDVYIESEPGCYRVMVKKQVTERFNEHYRTAGGHTILVPYTRSTQVEECELSTPDGEEALARATMLRRANGLDEAGA